MDLTFAAEQYAQAQAAVAAAQYYAANAMNAGLVASPQGAQGLASFGLLPQINASLLGTQVLGPQFMVRQSMGFDGVGQVQHPQQIMSQGATVDSSNGRDQYKRNSSDDDRRTRSRSPSRHRDRDRRSHERSRHREGRHSERRSRDRSRSRERRSSPRRSRDRRERTPESDDENRNAEPSNTIMIRGLAQHITENDLRHEIRRTGLSPKDVRLVRKKDTGASRGFAFVELYTVQDAQKWMEDTQGVLLLKDRFRALMYYHSSKEGRHSDSSQTKDWTCSKCRSQNFRRRDSCYRCKNPRDENEDTDDVSSSPTNIILLRGLDTLTTEDSVHAYLRRLGAFNIKRLRIGRDHLTNTSRGVCFIELLSLAEAVTLHNLMIASPPYIDDRLISVCYLRGTTTGTLSNEKRSGEMAIAAAQWSTQASAKKSEAEIEELAEYSATMYATTPEEKEYYLEYYRNYYNNGGLEQNVCKPEEKPTSTSASNVVTINGVEYKRYPTPDVSLYSYDEGSGYYYDPSTTLYYDPNSTYYYNSKTTSYLYWSQEHHTYIPCPTDDGQSGKNQRTSDDKKEKLKSAQRIAKDMEKWAKSQNQRKESSKSGPPPTESSRPSAPDESGFTVINKQPPSGCYVETPKVDPSSAKASSIASGLEGLEGYGSDSENEDQGNPDIDQGVEESKLTDWVKLACLLCLRQFPSKEKLQKHNQISDLHKQNLENWRQKHGQSSNSGSGRGQYRDRAKERRDKYGELEEAKPNFLKEKYLKAMEETDSLPQPERNIGSDNIGNKMLQKMGWKEGLGLGKANQGRTNIVEADFRGSQAGLGSQPGMKRLPNESYKDAGKRMLYQRYQ